jgi:choline-sulfatase
MSKPNILFLMGDQHPFSMLGCYGDRVVKTPTLDQLAEGGVVFDAAYCPSPLCAPSRAAMMTGRHVHDIEVWDNASPLRADWPTFIHSFRAAGYRTILSGKMHYVGPDQLHGFEERWTQEIYPTTFDWTYPSRKGVYINPPGRGQAVHRVLQSGIDWTWDMDYDEEVAFRTLYGLRTIERDSGDRPFFLCVSFSGPHYPYFAPQAAWDLYRDEDIEIPKIHPGASGKDPEHVRWFRQHTHLQNPVADEVCRRARHAMLSRITMIDEYCARILAALQDSGLEKDTIVLYASDHGDMLGEHGLWFKGTAYEASVRVPLIINGPDVPAARVPEPVSLLDLGPTLCGLSGIEPVYPLCDGQDLSSWITKGSFKEDGEAIVEYYGDGTWRGWRMIRRGDWKLIHVPDTEEVLYNLRQDPEEWQNLADDPAHREVRDSLSNKLKLGWDPDLCDERRWQSQERRMAILRALGRGEPRAWQQPSTPIPHPNPAYRPDASGPFQFSFSAK